MAKQLKIERAGTMTKTIWLTRNITGRFDLDNVRVWSKRPDKGYDASGRAFYYGLGFFPEESMVVTPIQCKTTFGRLPHQGRCVELKVSDG